MKVWLHQRVIPDSGRAFYIKREIDLPISPFIGLYIDNCQNQEDDVSEDVINMIRYDLGDKSIHCMLKAADYSEIEITREELINTYRDWIIE